jgi:hypothetical protein
MQRKWMQTVQKYWCDFFHQSAHLPCLFSPCHAYEILICFFKKNFILIKKCVLLRVFHKCFHFTSKHIFFRSTFASKKNLFCHHQYLLSWYCRFSSSYSKWKNSPLIMKDSYFYKDSLEGKLYDVQLLWHNLFSPNSKKSL